MDKFTLRLAHLESLPDREIGSEVRRGDFIGRMGNTGFSTFRHVHGDLQRGFQTSMYKLKDIEFDLETIRQLGFFFDDRLFEFKIHITTSFGDPDYYHKDGTWKMHPAFDAVPEDRHREPGKHSDMFWNRTPNGILLNKDTSSGYGNYVMYGFEA